MVRPLYQLASGFHKHRVGAMLVEREIDSEKIYLVPLGFEHA